MTDRPAELLTAYRDRVAAAERALEARRPDWEPILGPDGMVERPFGLTAFLDAHDAYAIELRDAAEAYEVARSAEARKYLGE